MEELQETIAEKKKKNRQKLGGEAVAGVRAVFYMENKKTLTGCISLPVEESLNSEEIVKNYQKQLSNIKLGKDSTLVDMQKCVGFEVIFFQKDYAGVLKPVSPAINSLSDPVIKEDTPKAEEKYVPDTAKKEDKAAKVSFTESRKGSFVSIPDGEIGHTAEGKKKLNEELRTKAYRLRALGIVGKDE